MNVNLLRRRSGLACLVNPARRMLAGLLVAGAAAASGQEVAPSITLAPAAETQLDLGPDVGNLSNGVTALAYAPDGRSLAVGLRDPHVVAVLDAATLAVQGELRGHLKMVARVAYLPDGKTLVSTGHDGTVRFWDVATRAETQLIDQFQGNVRGLAVGPDGARVVAGDFVPGDQGTTLLVNARDGRVEGELKSYRHGIECLAIAPDGASLATTSRDRTVRLWDLATRTQRASFAIKGAFANQVDFASGGRDLAAVLNDQRLVVLDAATLRPRYQVQVSTSSTFLYLTTSADGTLLAIADAGHVWLKRAADGVALGDRAVSAGGHINAIAFSPDGRSLAVAGLHGAIRVFRLESAGKSAAGDRSLAPSEPTRPSDKPNGS